MINKRKLSIFLIWAILFSFPLGIMIIAAYLIYRQPNINFRNIRVREFHLDCNQKFVSYHAGSDGTTYTTRNFRSNEEPESYTFHSSTMDEREVLIIESRCRDIP